MTNINKAKRLRDLFKTKSVIRLAGAHDGIAAVVIEDKLFPKVNSYIPGRRELAPLAEFVGKILAAKNAPGRGRGGNPEIYQNHGRKEPAGGNNRKKRCH